jgi:hypothetical protein
MDRSESGIARQEQAPKRAKGGGNEPRHHAHSTRLGFPLKVGPHLLCRYSKCGEGKKVPPSQQFSE